jgi:hypothetical protein
MERNNVTEEFSHTDQVVKVDEDDVGTTNANNSGRRKPLRNRSLNNVMELMNRPPSPDPKDAESYELSDECNIPYCPVHGVMGSRNNNERQRLFRNNSITLDGSVDGGDDGVEEIRMLGKRGRSVSDGHLLKPICIKDAQRRRMRELNQQSNDTLVRRSLERRTSVNDEFRRRFSAPPTVKHLNDGDDS